MFLRSRHRTKVCSHQFPNFAEALIRRWVIWPGCTQSTFKCCNMNYCPHPFLYSWNGHCGLMYCNIFSCHRQCSSRKCDLLTGYFGCTLDKSWLSQCRGKLCSGKSHQTNQGEAREAEIAWDRGALCGDGSCSFSSPWLYHTVKGYPDLVSFTKKRGSNFNQSLCTKPLTDQCVKCQWPKPCLAVGYSSLPAHC